MLYRQAFELQLKALIKDLVSLRVRYVDGLNNDLEECGSDEFLQKRMGHKLTKLLAEAMKHYEALDVKERFPANISHVVGLLHQADATGTAFRYAGVLPEDQEYVDLPNLANLLDECFDELVSVGDYAEYLFSSRPSL